MTSIIDGLMQPRLLVHSQWIGSINMLAGPPSLSPEGMLHTGSRPYPFVPSILRKLCGQSKSKPLVVPGTTIQPRLQKTYLQLCFMSGSVDVHLRYMESMQVSQYLSSSEQYWRSGRMKRNLPITWLALSSSLSTLHGSNLSKCWKSAKKQRVVFRPLMPYMITLPWLFAVLIWVADAGI